MSHELLACGRPPCEQVEVRPHRSSASPRGWPVADLPVEGGGAEDHAAAGAGRVPGFDGAHVADRGGYCRQRRAQFVSCW